MEEPAGRKKKKKRKKEKKGKEKGGREKANGEPLDQAFAVGGRLAVAGFLHLWPVGSSTARILRKKGKRRERGGKRVSAALCNVIVDLGAHRQLSLNLI